MLKGDGIGIIIPGMEIRILPNPGGMGHRIVTKI
jgi:hypothetical protein